MQLLDSKCPLASRREDFGFVDSCGFRPAGFTSNTISFLVQKSN